MRTDEKLIREVAAICDLPRDELAARWIKAYGCPPPKGIKRGLLERAAAWHLQAKYLGGLSATARKAAREATRFQTIACDRTENPPGDKRQAATLLVPPMRPGTRLMREWNGRMHVVDVTEGGFVFDGKTYRSLTAIAKRITGAHWSGPRFFGV